MSSMRNRSSAIYLAMVLTTVVIFIVDLQFPLGVAAGVPYFAVVLLSRMLGRQVTVLITTACVTLLVVVGFFIPFPDGPHIWIGVENRIIALLAIWTTAVFSVVLIRRNEVLRQERDFNKNLVDTAAAIILLVDGDGRIVYYNSYATTTRGLDLAASKEMDWIDVFIPEPERPAVRRFFADCVDKKAGQDATFSVLTSRQQAMPFSWTSHVQTQRDRSVAGVLLVGQDMTPLVEAQQQLVQSERLAAIGQAMASLSHEVRNELNSLQLALMLLDRQIQEPAAMGTVDRLREVGKRLARMFEDIRGFAAPIHLELSEIPIADVWRKAWSSAARGRAGEITLTEETSCQDLHLSLDGLRVEQVFRNLFENALAVCGATAVVTISCTTITRDVTSYLRISVRDNGPGLPAEVKARVFEPFFTTKSAGTGLGLPICKRIIEAHGGDLQVGEAKDGAEFLILLPLVLPTQ